MTKLRVNAGACGYKSVVITEQIEGKQVRIKIISACRMLQLFNQKLQVVDWTKGVFEKFCDSIVYQVAHETINHIDCPLPLAVIKAIQTEIDGALPKDVLLQFENDDRSTARARRSPPLS
jgi:hypothetical protein